MLILSFLSISMVLEFGNTAGRPSSWTMLGRARVNPCETQPGRRPRVGYAPARHLPVRRLCQNISISCWLCLNVLEALFCCDLNGSFGLEVWSDARVGSYGCFFQDNLLGVPTNHGNWGRWRFDIAVTPFVENTGGAMARSRADRNPGASSHNIPTEDFPRQTKSGSLRSWFNCVVEMVGPEAFRKIQPPQSFHFSDGRNGKPMCQATQCVARWWFEMLFIFTPILGEMIQFDEYSSDGLKPPTK